MSNRLAEWLTPGLAADRPTSPGTGIYLHRATDTGALTVWDGSAWRSMGGGSSPTTTEGDLSIRGASADERLAIGGAGKVLTSNGTTATWEVGSPITTQGDLAVGDATGAPVRLAKGAEGKVLRAGATTVSWEDPPAPSGVATLDAANVFTDLQTLSKSSGTWGAPIPAAAFRHNNGPSSWQGVGVRFEVKNGSDPAITYGYVLARAHGCGGDANDNLVEMRPAFSAGDPPVGLRVRCNVASAIWGVELLLAASGGTPLLQPCREAGSGDVDIAIAGLGTGGVRIGTHGTTVHDGTVQTVDATTTTVWSKALDDSTVYEVEITLVGRRTDATGRAVYRRRVVAWVESGALTVETPDVVGTDVETTAGYGIVVDADGTTLRVRATGDAGHTLRWTARVTLLAVST